MAAVSMKIAVLLFVMTLAASVAASGHGHGHDHEGEGGHTDDHSDHHGHDHAGSPHGHGSTDEDCDEDEDHDHGDHSDDDHEGHKHGDNDHDDDDHEGHHHHGGGHTDGGTAKPGKCLNTEHVFDGKSKYLNVMTGGPELNDFTFCTFATTDSQGAISGVIGSLNHEKPGQNLVAMGAKERKNTVVRIVFQGQSRKINTVPLGFNSEIHICMVTSSAENKITIFLNGKRTRDMKFRSIKPIPKGGKISVGKMNGDKYPMYTGTLRNFMMWETQLTEAQIEKIYKTNDCPGAELITLTEMNVVPMVANVKTEDCVDQEYTLDNTGDKVEYLELSGTIPELEFVTICVRVTTDGKGMIPGTIASYSTKSNPKMIVVGGKMGKDGPLLRVEVNGEVKTLNGQFAPNTKYCFCMEYHLTHGHLMTYVNGQFSRMLDFKYADPLSANGIIMLGQRQTKLGGCLDRDLAFSGKIQGFTIWGRVLSEAEMIAFCAEGKCPIDALVKSGPTDVVPSGRIFPSSTCPSHEFTLDNTGNKVEYIQYLKTFAKPYNYLTMCARIVTDANGMLPGAVGSYATKDMIDALYLGGEMKNSKPHMRVTLNGMSIIKEAPFLPNTDSFDCISYHIPHGHVLTYINGVLASDLDFHDAGMIPAGGTLIVGQKQGSFGGSFDRSRAYNGKIADVMVWDRVLSVAEMKAMATLNECPDGAIIDSSPSDAKKISTTM